MGCSGNRMGENGIQRRHHLDLRSGHVHEMRLIGTQNGMTGQGCDQWTIPLVNPVALQPQVISSVSHRILHNFLSSILMKNSTGLAIVGQGTNPLLALVIHKLLRNLKGCPNSCGRLLGTWQSSIQPIDLVGLTRIFDKSTQIPKVLDRPCEVLLHRQDPRQKSTMRAFLDDFLGFFGGNNGGFLQPANTVGILLELFQLKPVDLTRRDQTLKLIRDLFIQRVKANTLGTLDFFFKGEGLQHLQLRRVKFEDPRHLIAYEESCLSRASHQPTMVLTALSSVSSAEAVLSKRISISDRRGCGTS